MSEQLNINEVLSDNNLELSKEELMLLNKLKEK
jgi:hypothetical protein